MSLNILLLNSLASHLFSYAVNLRLSFPEVQRTFCFTFFIKTIISNAVSNTASQSSEVDSLWWDLT